VICDLGSRHSAHRSRDRRLCFWEAMLVTVMGKLGHRGDTANLCLFILICIVGNSVAGVLEKD
jgi:hypothetical protein